MAVGILKQFPQTVRPRPWSLFLCSSCSNDASQSLVANVVSILTHHRSKSRWSNLRSACPNGIAPVEFSEITLHLKNKPQLALRFFLWTKSQSVCHHNLASYSSVIHLLARARLTSHAYHLIRTAIRASDQNCRFTSPPLELFETLVKTYRDSGSAPFVFDLLIKACLDSKKLDPSIEIVRMLLSRGISPKVSTLNSLISRVCRSRGVDAGYAIYREFFRLDEEKMEISRRGFGFRVTPNVHTYNELMLCCYRHGLVERAEEIWHEMMCKPNAYSYSVLMAAFCEEGRMGDAEKLWEEMRNEEMEPDVVSYNTIIGGFCKIGDVGRAEEFFREMALAGVGTTASTYEHLVKVYCNVGDVDSAVLVYRDMSRRDLRPDASTLDVMVRLLCGKGRVQEGLEFVRCAVGKFDLLPREKSYEALVKGLCFEGRMEEALKVQAEMVGKGFQPNSEIYGAFVDGYIRQGNEEMAEALRKEMLQTQTQS
ncbi:Pentatricopeptide repeat-containing protein [Spatholobus suberectus]|nr:Pentatricopeptide repeat-containing protein [Spatholobus suberectus]